MDYKEKYDDLLYRHRNLRDKYQDLERKLSSAESQLYDANWKIRTELEPRIEQEGRAYDNYVLDPERY